jgi:sugar phosphate permease
VNDPLLSTAPATPVAHLRAARLRSARMQLFAATWMSYAGFYFTRKVFSVVKGPIKSALALDDVGVSNLWLTYLVTYALGQFLSAWLSRKMSNRTQLMLGMTTSVLCNVAIGALLPMGPSATPYIFVALGVHGVAQATGWPCNVGLMARWTQRAERGGVMAIWATCYQLGAVFAKLFASFLFGALGLMWSFWGTAVVLALVTVAFWLLAKERPEDAGVNAFADSPDDVTDPGAKGPTEAQRRQMLLVLAMGVIYFAFKFCRYALDSWSTLILSEHFHIQTEWAGYLSTAFDWVGFLGVLAAGWASDKLFKSSRVTVILIMTAGCVVATGLMYGVGLSSAPMFVVLLGVVGFMVMGPDSLLSGAGAMDTGTREQAARAAGIINGCGAVGPIVQERLIGQLKASYGDDIVFLVMLLVTVVAFVGVSVFWLTLRTLKIRL